MNETWIDTDEKTIRDDIVSIAKAETGLTNFKNVGVLRGLIEVISQVVFFIYRTAINPIYQNATLDKATGVFLSLWGLMLGVARKQQTKTEGVFTAAADAAGSLPAGVWAVVPGTDLRYKVTRDVPFTEGQSFAVPVIAEFPGTAYNISADTPLLLTRVIPGLDTVSVGDGWITTVGQDIEADDPYRERIKTRWKSQILGNTKEVYQYYAEEVTGVRSAKIIRTPRGPGSTDVIIAAVNGAPDDDLIHAVEKNLYDHELMGFDVQVRPPQVLEIDIDIEYSGDADETEVRLIAEQYVYRQTIGGRFEIRGLYDLYKPLNLTTLEILSPDRDVQAEDLYIIVGTITVTRTENV
jgi:uncharacterized phage protein gp47/JayE